MNKNDVINYMLSVDDTERIEILKAVNVIETEKKIAAILKDSHARVGIRVQIGDKTIDSEVSHLAHDNESVYLVTYPTFADTVIINRIELAKLCDVFDENAACHGCIYADEECDKISSRCGGVAWEKLTGEKWEKETEGD